MKEYTLNENPLSKNLIYSDHITTRTYPKHISEHVAGEEPEQMNIDDIAQRDQKAFRCYNIEGYKNKYINDSENTHCELCTFLATEKESKKEICALRYHNILLVSQASTDPYLIFPNKFTPSLKVVYHFKDDFDGLIPVDKVHRKTFFNY